jgi:hypothetical protein
VNSSIGAAPSASQAPSASKPVTGSPAAAGQPQTIHLILHPINDTVGSLTGCSSAGSGWATSFGATGTVTAKVLSSAGDFVITITK